MPQFFKNTKINMFYVPFVWAIGICFVDFTLIKNFFIPITLGFIFYPLILIYIFAHRPTLYLKWFVPILGLILVPLLQIAFIRTDLREFLFTYIYFGTMLFGILATHAASKNLRFHDALKGVVQLLGWLMMVAALLVILQFCLLNGLTSYATIPALGPFQAAGPGGPDPYVPLITSALKRPSGFYSEPSVAGWCFVGSYALVAIWASAFKDSANRMIKVVLIIGTCCTVSVSAILGMAVVVMLGAWTGQKSRNRTSSLFSAIALPGLGLIGIFIISSILGPRLMNIATDPSAYLRIFGPLELIDQTLQAYPLGRPFGSIEQSDIFFINWAGDRHAQIDNTLLLFVFHFGYLGVAIIVGLLISLVQMIIYRRRLSLALAAFMIIFFATGAGWTPKAMMICLLLIGTIFVEYQIKINRSILTR